MATINSAAILTAIREVLLDEHGELRKISSTRYLGDLPEGLDESEAMRRALVRPRLQISVGSLSRHPQSPPITGNVMFYSARVQVRIVRTITRLEQLSDADADALRALCVEDMDVVRQALEYPHNLDTTIAGAETGLVSGLLSYVDSSVSVGRAIDDGAQPITTLHNFTAAVRVEPQVEIRPPVNLTLPLIEEVA